MSKRKTYSTNTPVKSIMDAKSVAVKAMSFSEIPTPIQRGKGGRLGTDVYTMYGGNNLYPNYLLRLYNESAIHKAIIDSKVSYVLGDGIKMVKEGIKASFKVNEVDDIEDLMRKALTDYVIFNYFALEVVYNGAGEVAEILHVPASKIRSNSNHTKFWFSEDWANARVETLDFDGYDKTIGGRLESKLYFYSAYSPSVGTTYPTPEYSGAIKSIEIDIAIKDFHLNNINNTFSGNTIISFFRGEPTPEIKDEIVDSITGSYSGSKGDKIIFQFLEKDEKEPVITALNPTEWNEAYLTLRKDTTEDIVIGHSVTSPMLMGIKTEGQLGGATELETAYQIFKNLWVKVKRREFVSAFNDLIKDVYGEIEIADKDKIFPSEMSDTLKEKVMTIDELRASEGLSPLPDGAGNRLVGDPIVVKESAVVEAENMGFSRSLEDDLANGVNPYKELSEEEELEFNSIGLSRENAFIMESTKFSDHIDFLLEDSYSTDKLTDYLIKNKLTGKTFSDIQSDAEKAIGERYSLTTIKEEYGRLVALRVIPNTYLLPEETLVRIKAQYPDGEEEDSKSIRKVEIRYSYEGVQDNKNRAFCHRLVRANKLYTREDIQRIGALFGYDVFSYKGGYNCRHNWMINSVVRKS